MKLDTSTIVAEALLLVDEQGLDGLTMRALAKRLGVQASALYWHVGGREELVTAMAGTFYRKALEATPATGEWREWLYAFGTVFRRSLLEHRDSARLCAISRPDPERTDADNASLASPLEAKGLSRRHALTCMSSVIALSLGWAVYEQSSTMHDHLDRLVGFDRSYGIGLRAMVDGFPADSAP
jgi:TetR/AcrR family tetracycline transcriptional repressor